MACARISCAEGLIRVGLQPQVEVTASDAVALLSTIRFLAPEPALVLLDHRAPHWFSFEARLLLSRSPHIRALALWAGRPFNATAAEDLVATPGRAYPAAVFSAEEEAVQWLRAQDAQQARADG